MDSINIWNRHYHFTLRFSEIAMSCVLTEYPNSNMITVELEINYICALTHFRIDNPVSTVKGVGSRIRMYGWLDFGRREYGLSGRARFYDFFLNMNFYLKEYLTVVYTKISYFTYKVTVRKFRSNNCNRWTFRKKKNQFVTERIFFAWNSFTFRSESIKYFELKGYR